VVVGCSVPDGGTNSAGDTGPGDDIFGGRRETRMSDQQGSFDIEKPDRIFTIRDGPGINNVGFVAVVGPR
jgi:hypothetical protein